MVSNYKDVCICKINIDIIQRLQNMVLGSIVNAPWYIRNSQLHRDLGFIIVGDAILHFAYKHALRLRIHTNPEAKHLNDIELLHRRLNRKKPIDFFAILQSDIIKIIVENFVWNLELIRIKKITEILISDNSRGSEISKAT